MNIKFAIIFTVFILLIVISSHAQNKAIEGGEKAEEIFLNEERGEDITADFPGLRYEAEFSKKYNVWFFTFFYDDIGKVGFASESLEARKVVEFGVELKKLSGNDDHFEPIETNESLCGC